MHKQNFELGKEEEKQSRIRENETIVRKKANMRSVMKGSLRKRWG
jgi:hypothetical protein